MNCLVLICLLIATLTFDIGQTLQNYPNDLNAFPAFPNSIASAYPSSKVLNNVDNIDNLLDRLHRPQIKYNSEEPSKNKSRIFLGQQAPEGRFRHHAQLFVSYGEQTGTTTCAGSIIHPNWIVSAASCYANGYTKIIAVLGTLNIFDEKNRVSAVVRDIVYPSNYIAGTIYGNIALLRVDALEFNDRIDKIDVYKNRNVNFEGETAEVSGYGNIDTNETNKSGDLYYGHSTLVHTCTCADAVKSQVSNLHLCGSTFNDNSAICSGDFGSGLINLNEHGAGFVNLIGVAIPLGNANDCVHNKPNLFTNVSPYYKWMESVITTYKP